MERRRGGRAAVPEGVAAGASGSGFVPDWCHALPRPAYGMMTLVRVR